MPTPRFIAFYLPQFHTTPENDEWWGKGYTEWTATAQAMPLFNGHYQPHIPADLGFYDLRVSETRMAQAELAAQHGVHAFCYYHYWFGGKRLLQRPFDEVLRTGEPKFNFCLCWANHDWTAAWHQRAKHVLVKQPYPGMDDHRAHFYELLKAFSDDRYVKVDGKPLFLIYHPWAIPDLPAVADYWRDLSVKEGLAGLFLVGVNQIANWQPSQYGLDAAVMDRLPGAKKSAPLHFREILRQLLRKGSRPAIRSFKEESEKFVLKQRTPYESFPCIIPNWDNTPRYGEKGIVIHGSTPELFRHQVLRAIDYVKPAHPDHQLVFVKAWNEWGEGNHMEPDLKFGKGYLEVLRDEILDT